MCFGYLLTEFPPKQSAGFFARPQDQKDQLAWTTPQANRGYAAPGREKVSLREEADQVATLNEVPDLKETFEIGKEGVEGLPNNWPENVDDAGLEFTRTMKQFFITCQGLQMEVMRSIALGMGLEKSFFDEYTNGGDNNLRLLHYPGQPKSIFKERKSVVRAGRHTDYGKNNWLDLDRRI